MQDKCLIHLWAKLCAWLACLLSALVQPHIFG